MRKSKFSEHQIVRILKSVEGGRTVKDVCREHGVSSADLSWKNWSILNVRGKWTSGGFPWARRSTLRSR